MSEEKPQLNDSAAARLLPSAGIIWLNREIRRRRLALDEWDRIAMRRNICDDYGRNPIIDSLRSEIKMIEDIIIALEKGNDA